MMKTAVQLFSFLTLAVLIFSCEKTIEFNPIYTQPKIVINSVLRAGSDGIIVRVEKSRSVLDDKNYFEALPDAQVLLYENGKLVAELGYVSKIDTFIEYFNYGVVKKYPYEHGVFIDSTITINSGSTYRLEVSNSGFDPVHCETMVPHPVPLSDIDYHIEKIPEQFAFKVKLNLQIADPENEDNYYRIMAYKNRGIELAFYKNGYYYGGGYYGGGGYGNQPPYNDPDSIAVTDTIVQSVEFHNYVFSMDPVLTTNTNVDVLGTESDINEFFTDDLMNGNYTLSYWMNTFRDIYTQLDEYLEIVTTVSSISKELYLYSKSRLQQSNTRGNPFAEPVPVYTNVSGGLGIFGSEAFSTIPAIIGEYPVKGKTYINEYDYRQNTYPY
jgi:hypothetical protein